MKKFKHILFLVLSISPLFLISENNLENENNLIEEPFFLKEENDKSDENNQENPSIEEIERILENLTPEQLSEIEKYITEIEENKIEENN